MDTSNKLHQLLILCNTGSLDIINLMHEAKTNLNKALFDIFIYNAINRLCMKNRKRNLIENSMIVVHHLVSTYSAETIISVKTCGKYYKRYCEWIWNKNKLKVFNLFKQVNKNFDDNVFHIIGSFLDIQK